jgi:hypothetical protein
MLKVVLEIMSQSISKLGASDKIYKINNGMSGRDPTDMRYQSVNVLLAGPMSRSQPLMDSSVCRSLGSDGSAQISIVSTFGSSCMS